MQLFISVTLLVATLPRLNAFYLPGVSPVNYKRGDPVPFHVNAITSPESSISYDFYSDHLQFCQPADLEDEGESLGSVLFGDRIKTSPFKVKMLEDQQCKLLCPPISLSADNGKFLKNLVIDRYAHSWLIDHLPVGRVQLDEEEQGQDDFRFYSISFDMGNYQTAELFTHFNMTIEYEDIGQDQYRIVGAYLYPWSRATPIVDNQASCNTATDGFIPSTDSASNLVYTYDVHWVQSNTKWSHRWDNYIHAFDAKVHWFSLINSTVIVLFLSVMVAMILLRALHRDISRYNAVDAHEDVQEDFGWKLVHGDVFRAPVRGTLLSVFVGSGSQLICLSIITLAFAALGFLSPSSRGSLLSFMVALFVIFSAVSGYISARLYKSMGGEAWKRNVLMTAFLVPGVLFFIFTLINIILSSLQSSSAVPVGAYFGLMSLWFITSVPCCFIGAYFGFKQPRLENPLRTNQIPRQIPDQPFYLRTIPSMILCGILPFGAIFIELYFILNSIWFHRIYYMFGFLALVFVILVVTCSEIAILVCYFHLCAENYHWWWRSFFTAGATGFYVFGYGLLFLSTKLKIVDTPSIVLYLGWNVMISFTVFILTGTIGFLASAWFVRKIYGSIKID